MESLPDEILEEIFFRATAAAELEEDPLLPLKSINLVSRSWHSTFLSSPRLWRNIGYIRVDMHNCSMHDSKPDTEGPFLQGLTRHLSRAKSQPLAFSFDAGWTYITRVVATAGRALAVLSKHASQWQSVELTIHSAVIHALDGIDGNLPQLEQLTLDMQGTDPPPRLNHFAVAPRLSSVRIQFVGNYQEPEDMLVLPWSQLVEYQAKIGLHEKGLHAVLTSSPQLQTLESPYYFHPNTYFLDAPYRHTTLTRLRLRFRSPDSSCILRRLVLPGLLDLSVASLVPESVFSDIAALISSSRCLLTALAVLPTDASSGSLGGQFTRVLALCPMLEYLCLNGFTMPDVRELMSFWTQDEDEEGGVGAPKLVPELKRLDIRRNMIYLPPEEHYIALNALAKSREDMHRRGVAQHLLEIHVESVASTNEEQSLNNLRLLDYSGLAPDRELLEVRKWAEALKVALGEDAPTYRGFWSCCVPRAPRWYRAISGLKGALREMAAYKLKTSNVACLYHADIPCLLERVALLPPSDFPFGLIARARRILERWKPDLIQNAKASRFWIRKGRDDFEYVHLTSPRRVNDGLAWEIVIGVPGKAVLKRRRLRRAFE
ncbi:hypothetical protein DFP72DRAFT_875459 [Ephemerocybe angulata]|uniref:F-box domain-containing protein n=1 Tax=Ephemerocybe angulata TaxID=980116 RepID=A0A8H6IFT5_9AGAR|nr:hypothetical protein DFP72DRAFT_875459 [Tulosesus angulatus]